MGRHVAALIIASLGLVVACSCATTAQKKPAILCLVPMTREAYGTQDLKPPERVARELKELGFERGWHVGWDDLTPQYLRQFNAVLLYDMPCTTPGRSDPKVEQQLAMLRQYVEDGGGLWLSEYPYNRSKVEVQNALLAPWGGRILWELARDDATVCTLQPPCPALRFSWTNAISRSPITEGVQGLYYGLDFWEPGSPNTCPLQVSSDWQILARGMPTAASFAVNPSAPEVAGPGSIASAPPLLAVRQCGKGRVVLWPMSLVYTLMDGYHWMLEGGIVMHGRPPERPSDGARLTYNLLKWLVEPSVAGGMGGYVYQPPPAPPREAEPGFQEIDWSQVRPVSPLYPRALVGLVGAQTALSSGRGTPEEFAVAAKRAGYQFIAFTEDLERLDAPGWDKLVAACQALTGPDFAALPGLYYRTVYGAEYVTFGDMLIYPKPDWLGKVGTARRLRENDCFVRGLSDTPPIIMVYPRRNPRPLRVNAQFYGFATHTYEADKLVDESFVSYLELAREGTMLYPMAVHFVRAPEEIALAKQAGLQTCIRAEAPAGVVRSVQGMHQGRNPIGWCKPCYVSSGPEVQYFYADNWGTADLAVRNGDRHRLQLMARSQVGLKEVRFFDHTEVIRRFLPGGARELTLNVDGFHDRQHDYVAQITDATGQTAITWSRDTEVQECSHDMCGDNWNDMPTGKYNNDSGGGALRGTECQVSRRADLLMWPSVINQMGDGYATLKRSGMVCRFGWDLFYSLDNVYDGPGQPGIAYDSRAVVPNSWFEGEVRQRYFVRRPPGPHLTMVEGRLKLRRDIQMKGSPGIAFITIKGGDQLYVPGRGGMASVIRHPGRPEFSYFDSAPLAVGDYVSVSTLPATIFALDEGLSYGVWWGPATGGHPWAFVGVGQVGETMKAGTEVTWRLAVLSATDAEGDYPYARGYYPFMEGSNVLSEMVQKRMGLAGSPAYQVRPVVGKVESTRLVLRLAARDGGWRGVITRAQLPVPLPVYVSGLNPKWSAGIWYKGHSTLLSPEWPSFDEYGFACWTRNTFVVPRERTDEIQRIPVVEGAGYLQLDTEDADRDVFIGNFVTCDNPDLRLSFFRDPRRSHVEVHNPTDATVAARVRPAPGFDLLATFEKPVQVPAGASVTVDVP